MKELSSRIISSLFSRTDRALLCLAAVGMLLFAGAAQAGETPGQQVPAQTGNKAPAQKIQVTGRVVDANGEPMVGVSVIIKGTPIVVSTNANGDY